MPNAIEQIHGQITQVFGGRNPGQFFSLLMPGSVLDAPSFAYDLRGMKPAAVAEAESRLVDQMFDLAPVNGGSNGQRVSTQFLQALSVLMPNINPMMPALKNSLRDFLNTPVPAGTLVDGKPFEGTLQQQYAALYRHWLDKKLKWAADVQQQRDLFAADPATAAERFTEWFELNAEARFAEIDAAMGEVLAVFSPADMEALLGALAAGPGGEIQQAADIVKDIRLMTRAGGHVYPVELMPRDWFLELASDTDPVDLLQDPQFIAAGITARRTALQASIGQVQALLATVPTSAEIAGKVDDFSKAQAAYSSAQTQLIDTYGENTATAAEIYLAKSKPAADADAAALADLSAAGAKKKNGSAIDEADVKAILGGMKKLNDAQALLTAKSQLLADAGLGLAGAQAQSFSGLPVMLARLQAQLRDIEAMQSQVVLARPAGLPVLGAAPTALRQEVSRSACSQRFMALKLSFSASDMSLDTHASSQFSQTSWGVDLFFGSARGGSSSASAVSASHSLDSSTEILVGLKVAKVDIDRDWFDPGLFKLTNNMSRLSTAPVSEGPLKIDDNGIVWNDPGLEKAGEAILPCFPVSFVVAKDVSISFKAATGQLDAVKSVIDSRSAAGGGFLCFSAARSSASHAESQSLSSKSDGQTITIHMPGPQILGWILEMTPKDNSSELAAQAPLQREINLIQFINQLRACKRLSPAGGQALAHER